MRSAGEPLNLSAVGATPKEATGQLGVLLDALLAKGRQITTLPVANGKAVFPAAPPFPADDASQTDWAFRELQEAIEESRRMESV